MEHQTFEKKSLQLFAKGNPDWKALTKECVCFANAKGGIIAIGIEDKEIDPPAHQKIPPKLDEIIRKRISELSVNVGINVSIEKASNAGEWIKIEVLPSQSTIASTTDGQYYIRIADHCKPVLPDELSRLFTDKSAFQWETKVTQKIYYENCDIQKINQFITDIKNSDRVSVFVKQKSDEELLRYYQFINEEGYLTNLGILWIGKREQRARLLYAPIVQFLKYDEHENKVRKEVWDDFSFNPKELVEEIWYKIPEWREGIEFSDGILGRYTIYHYNENVVRELLANALVHRPYTTRGDIFINLYQDRLEIHNPGLLPLGVTPQNILHQSVKRNELLSKIFYDLGLMEREGSGYDKIYEIQLSEAKAIPIVEEGNDRVSVTLYKQIKSVDIIRFLEEVKKRFYLTQKEIICLGIIVQHQAILATEFARIIQSTNDKQIKNWLGNLLDYEVVKTRGRTKGTEYYINPEFLKNIENLEKTTLKQISKHRLEALILTDLERFGKSSISRLHSRIGKDIPLRKLRFVLSELTKVNKIQFEGERKKRLYFIDKNQGK
ncbi:ATP-binding protein [Raineya orbicola]|uniref:Putative transcriptional regulator n=1 Tax=Raineya orbicola TaxID=2016530 RepID=A0A2N3IDF6_9BACT|nr:ATP-binding protein [Raineya orbicola]PKQ68346.1 putative transcriptional regulator [Raineya orbicola]